MTLWKLTLAYDGTPYHGWQVQPGLSTIQGTLAEAIHRTTGERVLPQGSGRTDSGVHALAQVASFALDSPIPPANLHRALNRCLPTSIRVLAAEIAPPNFHARHSAIRKTYEYRIFPLHPDRICPPTLAPYVWPCPWPLDLDALSLAGRHVLGTHDFTSFAATDPDLSARSSGGPGDSEVAASGQTGPQRLKPECKYGVGGTAEAVPLSKTDGVDGIYSASLRIGSEAVPLSKTYSVGGTRSASLGTGSEAVPLSKTVTACAVRTVYHSHWHAHDELLVYTVTGSGFLHHMVRNLVGTFVQAGARRLDPDSIPTLLAARNRAVSGPTAPPTGLFLVSVEYPETESCNGQRTMEQG